MKNHNRSYDSDTDPVAAAGWAKKKPGAVFRIASRVYPARAAIKNRPRAGAWIGAQITSFNFPNTPVRRDSSREKAGRRE
jgi:hypothetical protein